MSRIGKLPILIPEDVKVSINDNNCIQVLGPKGELRKKFLGNINLTIENNCILVFALDKNKFTLSMRGTVRSIINNMVKGVKYGFTTELEINGVGYRASLKDNYINLLLGKSHNTKIQIPSIISAQIPKPSIIILNSIDKEKLGQFVATIIKERPPEPYKGKGIKRKGQFIPRKEGKKTK